MQNFSNLSIKINKTGNRMLFTAAVLLSSAFAANAQVGVGTITPEASAQLDVSSDNKGLLIPRLTDAQRLAISSPANGLLVYQTTPAPGFWYYSVNQWVRLNTSADPAPASNNASGYAANTGGGVVAVILGGTSIPLPNAQLFSPGIFANGANTSFTVSSAGRYQLSYSASLTAALLMGTQSTVNGSPIAASQIQPVLALSNYRNSVIVDLQAGDTLSLQFYGLLGAAVLANGGNYLSIVRLQ